jgi:peptidoglycan-associated lipoprotein
MFRFLKFALIAAMIATLGACASTPEKPAPVTDNTVVPVQPNPDNEKARLAAAQKQQVDPLRDPENILSQRLVFFAFDSYTVEPQFRELIEAHAHYLQTHPSATMTIRGNTDERGTHEYNIALGQRRADAVKHMMVLLGADPNRIETVSFGKEMPRNPAHNEAAWAENRRDEIVYVTE